MRLSKLFGLAVLAAVAAMAFVGATSVSANTSTALCKTHTGLTCASNDQWNHLGNGETIHLVNEGVGTLLSSIVDVLCLTLLGEILPLALGTPQNVHGTLSTISGCGTTSTHNNCTVTVEEQGLGALLKTGLNEGSIEGLNGQVRLQCSNIPFIGSIDCKYSAVGLLFEGGGEGGEQHVTANDTPIEEIGSKFFCPDEPTLDGLGKTLPGQEVYLLE